MDAASRPLLGKWPLLLLRVCHRDQHDDAGSCAPAGWGWGVPGIFFLHESHRGVSGGEGTAVRRSAPHRPASLRTEGFATHPCDLPQQGSKAPGSPGGCCGPQVRDRKLAHCPPRVASTHRPTGGREVTDPPTPRPTLFFWSLRTNRRWTRSGLGDRPSRVRMAKGGGKARGCARELCLLRAVGLFCAIFSFLYGCVVAAASVSAPPRRPPPRREGEGGRPPDSCSPYGRPRGRRWRNAPREGGLGRRSRPGTWLPPDRSPPRGPLFVHFPTTPSALKVPPPRTLPGAMGRGGLTMRPPRAPVTRPGAGGQVPELKYNEIFAVSRRAAGGPRPAVGRPTDARLPPPPLRRRASPLRRGQISVRAPCSCCAASSGWWGGSG